MKEYSYSLVIGRMQPPHLGHVDLIKKGLEISETVIIMLGSVGSSPNIKNPFTFEQRQEMLRLCFDESDNHRIKILGVRDYHYSEADWLTDIQNQLSEFIQEGDSKVIIGNFKDSSSYYLKYFPSPEWDLLPCFKDKNLSSTEIREILFTNHLEPTNSVRLAGILPEPVYKWLLLNYLEPKGFNPDPSSGHKDRMAEYKFIQDYKQKHQFKEELPYKPIFTTVDSLVICSGHVLIIKRKLNPGKGLFALPGGFVKETELLKDAAIRELKEETGIRVSREALAEAIEEVKVFDNPNRSLRGRTITHCHIIKLKDGTLPEVKAGDDASECYWMPFYKIHQNMDKFYEDHFSIIESILKKY